MSLDNLIDAIADQGWYIWDDFLSVKQVRDLCQEMPENWRTAQIGRSDSKHQNQRRRSDKIQWLQPTMGFAIHDYLERMEHIRHNVNRALFLGLFEYEAHFAKYDIGDAYEKHYDAFQGRTNRRLTTVMYLNEHWTEADGGKLKLYSDQDELIETVAPYAGRLVVFLSERFPHEVCISHAERFSIAGWFRTNGVSEQCFDISR
ncbi:SM-20 protein [Vibrio sp. CAIM 722]|uniref:SM-20 protein n=1 Tax=Vibrio eleionomae TaxID=2653505 RepID=A0A7X4LHB7_9VIBR|nr:2OG-Fe(II) oxygenase [Vibrio eleionomae]MZI91939.1 SM-20 protein [Vibrio eleionomae]